MTLPLSSGPQLVPIMYPTNNIDRGLDQHHLKHLIWTRLQILSLTGFLTLYRRTSLTWMDSQNGMGSACGLTWWGHGSQGLNSTYGSAELYIAFTNNSCLTRSWLPNHGPGIKLGSGAVVVSKVQGDQMIILKQSQKQGSGRRCCWE